MRIARASNCLWRERQVTAPDEAGKLARSCGYRGALAYKAASFRAGLITLYRGSLDRLLVPLDFFTKKLQAVKPDFADFDITDSGQTLRFGNYEAASSAVLYEFDAAARKRMKERERDEDATFGGALKRLRVSKGISRGDFPGLDAKTVARIERNEVHAPHGETLGILAKRLGVKPGAIKTY